MGKPELRFSTEPTRLTRDVLRMIEQGFLQQRAKAAMRYIVHSAAETMLEEVKSRIPTGRDYSTYRSSLRLVQSGVINPVFAVAAEAVVPGAVSADTDVLYFEPVNTKVRIPPGNKLLMKHQPWTADTLPFMPPSSQMKVTKRKVSKTEVAMTKKRIMDTKTVWERDFAAAGVRIDPPKEVAASPDLAYTALRLEYGLGGSRSVAHWRPALVATKRRVAELFTSDTFGLAVIDPRSETWRSWRNLSAPPVPATEVTGFAGFQDKIR